MFTTVEMTKEITGYDVDLATVHQAQHLVEAFIGKVEAEIDNANDAAVLTKAVAYQAAYMQHNPALVFEQVALVQDNTGDSSTTFDADFYAPFIAPLAIIACRRLSWLGSKSVHTGSYFGRNAVTSWSNN